MECTIEQLATQTALVPVAFLILFMYTSSTRATVLNQGCIRNPTSPIATKHPRLFLGCVYAFALIATSSQIIFAALAWTKGAIWLKLSSSSIFIANVLREYLWLKCLPNKLMFYVNTEAGGSSSFGRYYIISIAVSMVTFNGGTFIMLLPQWVRNIAITSASMVYFGHLAREWWKLCHLSQDKATKTLTAANLLINALFFGIGTGISICLLLLGRSTEPVSVMILICWIFVIRDYTRYYLRLRENHKIAQETHHTEQFASLQQLHELPRDGFEIYENSEGSSRYPDTRLLGYFEAVYYRL